MMKTRYFQLIGSLIIAVILFGLIGGLKFSLSLREYNKHITFKKGYVLFLEILTRAGVDELLTEGHESRYISKDGQGMTLPQVRLRTNHGSLDTMAKKTLSEKNELILYVQKPGWGLYVIFMASLIALWKSCSDWLSEQRTIVDSVVFWCSLITFSAVFIHVIIALPKSIINVVDPPIKAQTLFETQWIAPIRYQLPDFKQNHFQLSRPEQQELQDSLEQVFDQLLDLVEQPLWCEQEEAVIWVEGYADEAPVNDAKRKHWVQTNSDGLWLGYQQSKAWADVTFYSNAELAFLRAVFVAEQIQELLEKPKYGSLATWLKINPTCVRDTRVLKPLGNQQFKRPVMLRFSAVARVSEFQDVSGRPTYAAWMGN